ncbi:hypothetical protein BX661DRAFT_187133 [Kickxella alabastrina]|uniref:uncharacterized protein n=1 Tax=Kickxella alabastrina TaxID=61397 RepID=UPI00221F76D9|nr:uncharacterized protein BX661DRAFT_187133 [Kickxella alabastrina]KAI7822772.1 hypothetical protein BX661DRAFT_187133 [Kickxella alabastrina]
MPSKTRHTKESPDNRTRRRPKSTSAEENEDEAEDLSQSSGELESSASESVGSRRSVSASSDNDEEEGGDEEGAGGSVTNEDEEDVVGSVTDEDDDESGSENIDNDQVDADADTDADTDLVEDTGSITNQVVLESGEEECDEEFVQAEVSESETEKLAEAELLEQLHMPSGSDSEGSAIDRWRCTPQNRLRRSLRGSDMPRSEDRRATGIQTTPRRQPLRSAKQRRVGGVFDTHGDQQGYVSSPTASAASRRRAHLNRAQQLSVDASPIPAASGNSSDEGLRIRTAQTPKPKAKPPGRRKIAPSLVSLDVAKPESDSLYVSPALLSASSPSPVIDKPREERSYREFFPELNVHMPLAIKMKRATPSPVVSAHADFNFSTEPSSATPGAPAASHGVGAGFQALASPLDSSGNLPGGGDGDPHSLSVPTDLSLMGACDNGEKTPMSGSERPLQSRTSSSLSIRLFFNDPDAQPRQPLSAPSLATNFPFTRPPLLRPTGMGKSTLSYSGTPQSSVVVLAPKKPVLTLPETRFKRLEGKDTPEARYKAIEFKRPESHYIHNTELTEKDLAERVEYDLEDVDREWLQRLNADRCEQGISEVPANLLEAIIDHIEKEWFDLVKDVQKAISAIQQESLPAEESACAICGEEECDNTNAIVFCDGCNLAVHQDCYGVPYIPEGQWLCRKCMLSPDKDVSCVLCPQRGGAFKKTTTNKWAHLLCALWIPEVGISNTVYMEPIDSVDQIPRSRWKLYCHLCNRKVGACIQCSHRQCFSAFHPTCARRAHLAMAVKPDRRTGETIFRAFCERHTPAGHAQAIDVEAPLKFLGPRRKSYAASLSQISMHLGAILPGGTNGSRPFAADPFANGSGSGAKQWPPSAVSLLASGSGEVAELVAQALGSAADASQAKSGDDASLQLTMRIFNPDRPALNEFVFQRVLHRLPSRIGMHQRSAIVLQVARFWALKRSLRHGAPLLKRLHLEPWTASVTQQRALEMAEEQRQAFMRRLRTDLERVRLLVESVRRREREKLKRARLINEYVQRVVDPLTMVILPIIEELLEKRDPRGVLSHPVTEDQAPDYFDLITEPMDLSMIKAKVLAFTYSSIDEFDHDLELVVRNCMKYNKPNTYYYQLASRIKRHIDRLIAGARTVLSKIPMDPATGRVMLDFDFDIFSYNTSEPAVPRMLLGGSSAAVLPVEGEQADPDAAQASDSDGDEPDDAAAAVDAAPEEKATPRITRSRAKIATPASQERNKLPALKLGPLDGNSGQPAPEDTLMTSSTMDTNTPHTAAAANDIDYEEENDKDAAAENIPAEMNIIDNSKSSNADKKRKRSSRTSQQGAPAVSKRRATTSSHTKAPPNTLRRMTLFEQMSVPPPDVRISLRKKFAISHPDESLDAAPGSEIPDNINVLRSRLRRTSSAVVKTPVESPVDDSPRSSEEPLSPADNDMVDAPVLAQATPRKRKRSSAKDKDPAKVAAATTTPGKLRTGVIPTAAALGEDPTEYPVGTVVWAKMASYPWFPAEICAPDDARAPNQAHDGDRDDKCKNVLVFFFNSNPANRSWKWVSAKQICKLGVDRTLDGTFFKAKKSKSASMTKSMRMAYFEACKFRGIEPLAP